MYLNGEQHSAESFLLIYSLLCILFCQVNNINQYQTITNDDGSHHTGVDI